MISFDIIIIGGGHAGCEAAWITSEFNLKVGLITLPDVGLASAPCNPAVGGVGKGQVVREIDALGGLIGKLTDLAGIQYRILNESKGYAVQSTRAQIDKDLYSKNAEILLSQKKNIEILKDEVFKITKISNSDTSNHNNIYTLECKSGLKINTKKIIVTAGTFLNAKTHIGKTQKNEGRVDKVATCSLNELLNHNTGNFLRFKTGTPPRLKMKTLNYGKFIEQKSDTRALNFHWNNDPYKRNLAQVSCHLTHTSEKTMQIIRENQLLSPVFNGQIKGVGPRYCPSIEDKGDRYPDRNIHHIFVEPEGLSLDTIYPNGISTCLPKDIQKSFIQSIEGFEKAEIEIFGYAVEYDVVDTFKLHLTLEHKNMPGMYFAGQLNGTSGYEEAAGQGLIAGINSALSCLRRPPFVLSRESSYIGVMIQDLVTIERDEPYRLFTARNENRLYVREDNTINRLFHSRQSLNLFSEIDIYQKKYIEEFTVLEQALTFKKYYTNQSTRNYFKEKGYGDLNSIITLADLIRRSSLNPVETLTKELTRLGLSFMPEVILSVAISEKYKGYIKRNEIDKDRIDRFNNKKIKWENLVISENISNECRQRIKKIQPHTFGQLKRMDGIRPATLAYVARDLI
ncbi:MAG: tRNA uridine-5-carboxymethylaminomethyl(34) synthesis enzyme MnmG [Bacteriovoracaceae bacterium]|jgi:tRNA uridine 5-carboxymethylaminomethyl modification enzyme|nr:tRNA uridine-5-carboxymethylaminomethyl(34) synthesis enzyme MnmG [Bacteriovoracaceae bacterium]